MIFQGLAPSLLIAIGIGALMTVVVLYTVRWRLPQRIVATTSFWLEVKAGRRGGGHLGALENFLSLLLHLVAAAALVLAAAEPRLPFQSAPGRAVLIVLDRSASMGTFERIEPRIDIARRRAYDRIEASAMGDAIGLVLAGGTPEIALPLGHDVARLRQAISSAGLRLGPGRLEEAVRIGCSLLADRHDASLVVITDGSEPIGECPDAAVETVSVGTSRSNLGIVAFSTSFLATDPAHVSAFAEVLNASAVAAQAELRIDLDGRLLQLVPLQLAPGERLHRTLAGIPIEGAGRLVARLTAIHFSDGKPDALPDDDQAFALVRRRSVVAVDLVGASTPLEMVLAANQRYAVTKQVGPGDPHGQVTVVSGPIPAPLPPGNFLLINPSGPGAPVPLGAPVNDPAISFWRDQHPVLHRVVVLDLRVAQARRTQLPASATPLVGGPDATLVFAQVDKQRRIVALPFELESSNLPLRVGFPVLIYNAIDWLAQQQGKSDDDAPDSWRVRSDGPVELLAPGARSPVQLLPVDHQVTIAPSRPGFYALSANGRPLAQLAASVTSNESAVSPLAGAPGTTNPARIAGRLVDRELAPWLLVLALSLVLLEWFTFHRRKTI